MDHRLSLDQASLAHVRAGLDLCGTDVKDAASGLGSDAVDAALVVAAGLAFLGVCVVVAAFLRAAP